MRQPAALKLVQSRLLNRCNQRVRLTLPNIKSHREPEQVIYCTPPNGPQPYNPTGIRSHIASPES
jgi:hypothetical protein